jgi:molybdopterin molybdotransferase
MSQFLRLLPPDEARALLLSQLANPASSIPLVPGVPSELIDTLLSIGRVSAEDIVAPVSLPEFPRSTVDGYAVRASDTFGASDSMPAYLYQIGEIPMGETPSMELKNDQCVLIHTGGMVPKGADAILMLEYTQEINPLRVKERNGEEPGVIPGQKKLNQDIEIEIMRPVAEGENIILVGEDVEEGKIVLPKGRWIRPQEVGGLVALGILSLRVAKKPRVAIISSGDEVVDPKEHVRLGQVRDVNSYTLSTLVTHSGGEPVLYGIVPDQMGQLKEISSKALSECDVVIITAGSSMGTRDRTSEVINSLGDPGVLVHGINTRPGKPTILGVCSGKAVIGLPGNPVSALVNGYLFVLPVIDKLLGIPNDPWKGSIRRPSVRAKLTVNLPSLAGREDWWPVKLISVSPSGDPLSIKDPEYEIIDNWLAEPIFGKSNLIFTLISADGLLRISPDVTGLSAGEEVDIVLI